MAIVDTDANRRETGKKSVQSLKRSTSRVAANSIVVVYLAAIAMLRPK
jgi:hypothetical protein